MTVARILASKGREVATTQTDRTLAEVAAVLSQKKIGAVVVTDTNGGVLGILSERDIVRAVAKMGSTCLTDTVANHMTAKVVTTGEEQTVQQTMEKMSQGRFRHLPVIKEGRLVGLVSIGDVVQNRLKEMEKESQALREYITGA